MVLTFPRLTCYLASSILFSPMLEPTVYHWARLLGSILPEVCVWASPLFSSLVVHILDVFLVTLATSRRVNSIPSFSGPAQVVEFSTLYSSVSLILLAEFRTKNQYPGESHRPIVIPALTSILGPDDTDNFLCSVMSALLPAAYQTTSSYLEATLHQCV